METEKCNAQTYRYQGGVQVADFCESAAVAYVSSLDGSKWPACRRHATIAAEAGADVTDRRSVTP